MSVLKYSSSVSWFFIRTLYSHIWIFSSSIYSNTMEERNSESSNSIFAWIWVSNSSWLVVFRFTAKVISWRSVTHMCFLAFSHLYYYNFSFQSHRLLFSHASAEVRGDNTPERNFASTGGSNSQPAGHESYTLTTEPPSSPVVSAKVVARSISGSSNFFQTLTHWRYSLWKDSYLYHRWSLSWRKPAQ